MEIKHTKTIQGIYVELRILQERFDYVLTNSRGHVLVTSDTPVKISENNPRDSFHRTFGSWGLVDNLGDSHDLHIYDIPLVRNDAENPDRITSITKKYESLVPTLPHAYEEYLENECFGRVKEITRHIGIDNVKYIIDKGVENLALVWYPGEGSKDIIGVQDITKLSVLGKTLYVDTNYQDNSTISAEGLLQDIATAFRFTRLFEASSVLDDNDNIVELDDFLELRCEANFEDNRYYFSEYDTFNISR